MWCRGSQRKKVFKRGGKDWLYHVLVKDQIKGGLRIENLIFSSSVKLATFQVLNNHVWLVT